MKILFTGANGFLGRNVIPILKKKSFQIKTVGTRNTDYIFDISKDISSLEEKFDVVFHAAGKAHCIPKNLDEEKRFYDVNFSGTKNLCKALENNLPQVFIFVSTVAVYGNDSGENITEEFPLAGVSPYAKSKIMAENFLKEWCEKNNIRLFIFRAPLIAGPNPPGNLGDMVKAIKTGRYFNIAGGKAEKSLLWVEDFADLTVLSLSHSGGIYNVCDDYTYSFKEIAERISSVLKKKSPRNIPFILAKLMAVAGDILGNNAPINSQKLNKITQNLTFSNNKIKKELRFSPTNVMKKFQI
ncbi:NAD-dependent epimerase/dehydratase family protein [Chryseobacterium lineare]